MPWKVTEVSDQRWQFVVEYLQGETTMTALCAAYEIERKTGYKILARFFAEGRSGLADRPRAPHHQRRATPAGIVDRVVAFKQTHPCWGPRKIKERLLTLHPETLWPAASTIGDILKCHGLVAPRRPRHRTPPYSQPFAGCGHPNDVWCADYKGWFRTRDGQRCDPFTLSDACSRFLLRCQMVPQPDYRWTQPIVDAAFREFGLPRAIRSDNGPPFASVGLGGLSRLSIAWIKLGITPERIAPAAPQQNGRHERMHRTLKEYAITPPAANARQQQRAFDRFRKEYNHERPHEALGQNPPASVYRPSPRPYPARPPEIHYPEHGHVRKVGHRGSIRWNGHWLSMSRPLIGEWVGLVQHDEDHWHIHFGPVLLAIWNQRDQRLEKPKTRRVNDNA